MEATFVVINVLKSKEIFQLTKYSIWKMIEYLSI